MGNSSEIPSSQYQTCVGQVNLAHLGQHKFNTRADLGKSRIAVLILARIKVNKQLKMRYVFPLGVISTHTRWKMAAGSLPFRLTRADEYMYNGIDHSQLL
jgi:hypothetical protein